MKLNVDALCQLSTLNFERGFSLRGDKGREDKQVASNQQRRPFDYGIGARLVFKGSLGSFLCFRVVVEFSSRPLCHFRTFEDLRIRTRPKVFQSVD